MFVCLCLSVCSWWVRWVCLWVTSWTCIVAVSLSRWLSTTSTWCRRWPRPLSPTLCTLSSRHVSIVSLNFIVQCAWFQAACNPCTCHGCQCSAVLYLLLLRLRFGFCWPLCTFINYIYSLLNITSLRRQAATDSVLWVIDANPNWPVYADVFEHPLPRLASRRPISSDMTSVDTVMQWREDWSSASVVTHSIVANPTIWQSGFDIPRHTWSLIIVSGQVKAHVMLTCTNGDSRPVTFLWLWPVTDHEPHYRHMPINKIWRWTESTPRSRWWCSHMAGIYSLLLQI